MANDDHVLEVQLLKELVEIVGPRVDVVALPCLLRSPMSTAVVGNYTAAVIGQEEHLVLPVVRVERPAVAEEEDGAILLAVVLVVELSSVTQSDVRHCVLISDFDRRS